MKYSESDELMMVTMLTTMVTSTTTMMISMMRMVMVMRRSQSEWVMMAKRVGVV